MGNVGLSEENRFYSDSYIPVYYAVYFFKELTNENCEM